MMNINTTTGSMARKGVVLSLSVALGALAFGANLTPVKPEVEHCKKATCGIKWQINSTQPIKGFIVYRGLSSDYYEADPIADVGNTVNKLTDWGADRYTEYYYWVVPYDYNEEGPTMNDPTRYSCKNHRYWSSGDVYLTASVKSIAIGSTLPLYFKIDVGTPAEPFYDHMKPEKLRIARMQDLEGRIVDDIAEIYSNRGEKYMGEAAGDSTFLNASGAFGYLIPRKPGKLWLSASYKSATVGTTLCIEIKKPTFNLYAPAGSVDVVDCHLRDLYLKCNGKFVRPDDASFEPQYGESVAMWPCTNLEKVEGEFEDGLYDNSFGFLNMYNGSNADTTSFDIYYNDMFVTEYQITPMWNFARKLSFFYLDNMGREVSSFGPSKTYQFGIKYGDVKLPLKVSKCGWTWLTELRGEGDYFDRFGLWWFSNISVSGDVDDFDISTYNTGHESARGELGYFSAKTTGSMELSVIVIDRKVTDTIYFVR